MKLLNILLEELIDSPEFEKIKDTELFADLVYESLKDWIKHE